jgi:PKD repeat protein
VSVNFGDRSKAVASRRASHSYRRAGKYTVRVTVTDAAGNATVLTRRVTITG